MDETLANWEIIDADLDEDGAGALGRSTGGNVCSDVVDALTTARDREDTSGRVIDVGIGRVATTALGSRVRNDRVEEDGSGYSISEAQSGNEGNCSVDGDGSLWELVLNLELTVVTTLLAAVLDFAAGGLPLVTGGLLITTGGG